MPQIGTDWCHELSGLLDNWDGYGSKSPTPEALATVERFALVPLHDGGIQLEAHCGGTHIEVCVLPSGQIESVMMLREAGIQDRLSGGQHE
jgi:hypothetical protein